MVDWVICDGSDHHRLGWSGGHRLLLLIAAAALVAVVFATGLFDTLGVIALAVAASAVLVVGISRSLDADRLVLNRFGWRKSISLREVVRLDRHLYRGNLSLRLRRKDGKLAGSVPITGLAYRLEGAAALHLLHHLDRPDVSWGPGTWETLVGRAPADSSVRLAHAPEGAELPAKAIPLRAKLFLYVPVGAALVLLFVLTSVQWLNYLESRRIQNGPEALATLQREWQTQYSDRGGTHHTTHFQVSFLSTTNQSINAVVDARGRYNQLPPGDRFQIRYDPGRPTRAELPGAPMHSLGEALVLTVLAMLLLFGSGIAVRAVRRSRPAAV